MRKNPLTLSSCELHQVGNKQKCREINSLNIQELSYKKSEPHPTHIFPANNAGGKNLCLSLYKEENATTLHIWSAGHLFSKQSPCTFTIEIIYSLHTVSKFKTRNFSSNTRYHFHWSSREIYCLAPVTRQEENIWVRTIMLHF